VAGTQLSGHIKAHQVRPVQGSRGGLGVAGTQLSGHIKAREVRPVQGPRGGLGVAAQSTCRETNHGWQTCS
jgi:hypothetical protein